QLQGFECGRTPTKVSQECLLQRAQGTGAGELDQSLKAVAEQPAEPESARSASSQFLPPPSKNPANREAGNASTRHGQPPSCTRDCWGPGGELLSWTACTSFLISCRSRPASGSSR